MTATVIILPAGPTLTSGDICRAFGITRQALDYRRKKLGFPSPSGRNNAARYETRAVSQWADQRGYQISWI